MTTAVDIGNQSLAYIAARTTITALNDGSVAGNAIGLLYQPAFNVLVREIEPAFAFTRVSLGGPVAVTLINPFLFAYSYPAECLRLRQIAPAPGQGIADDPQPVRWQVASDNSAGKVILTNQGGAVAVILSSTPQIDKADASFIEALVRRLANPLAMAIAGRPDFARELLEQSERYAQMSENVDEN